MTAPSPLRSAFVSRYGDRCSGDFVITKTGVNRYSFDIPAREDIFIQVQPLTPDRVTTRQVVDGVCHIYTYNLRDGHHPGADLAVILHSVNSPTIGAYARIESTDTMTINAHVGYLKDSGSARSARVSVKHSLAPPLLDAADWQWVIQPLANYFVLPRVINSTHNSVTFDTLITRVPPTPIETNVEVAFVRHVGPIRNR